MPEVQARPARVLLVDDEESVTRCMSMALRKSPLRIQCANSGLEALELLGKGPFDVVVSDERMPGMAGSELLTQVRSRYPETVRIILSGQASLEAAVRAINNAEIYRYLMKPCSAQELASTIQEALEVREQNRSFKAWKADQSSRTSHELSLSLDRSLGQLWLAFQPILDARTREIRGYEALVRSDHAELNGPERLLAAVRQLGRENELAHSVRNLVAKSIESAPADAMIFVNANPSDLCDPQMLDGSEALARHAERIVIEITERESLGTIDDFESRIVQLRSHGYRIAVDDVGSGYSGLGSVALILPDMVKIDMELVRGADRSPTKQCLIRAMVDMCRDLNIKTIAEGVETQQECSVVVDAGCDYLQGFLFAAGARTFATKTAG